MKFLVIFFLNIFDFFYRLNLVNFLKKNNIHKFDTIFDIGAHKGESIKSIGDIVSGGELSRIMMAIKLSINISSNNKFISF